ncbi:MAG: PspC domain-containing protein [Bacteroidales bacterium]|nr:PspC domain-containing protein [Bacteroidales bacterium]
MTKRLFRSKSDKMIAGVCGGLANYFNIDPTLVRLAWVVLTLCTAAFPGIIGYIIAMIIVPYDQLEIR